MKLYYKTIVRAITILTFLLPAKSIAQGKFIEGYIISSKQDTLKGFIRYESWNLSPVSIDFKNENSSALERINALDSVSFYLPSVNEKYVSRKIGLLYIDNSQVYAFVPSFQAKDSITVFLQEITSGPGASLLEYVDETERQHYFLEKDNKLTELIYYPYRRSINGKEYLVKVEEYKNQLAQLLSDHAGGGVTAGSYTVKELAKVVDRYNKSLGHEVAEKTSATQSQTMFDIQIMGGIEGWKEPGITLKNTHTFGFGLRISLPRNFNNRYFRFVYAMMPGNSTYDVYNFRPGEKTNFKTMEISSGTHFGAGNIRPNIGFDFSFPLNNWRSGIIGPHIGITFRRQLSIEISHFANVATVFSEIGFFGKPRISLSYYLNLNRMIQPGK